VLICGRYEGVDERVADFLADRELSIGDYVLSGGEMAAAVILEAVTRLLPGAVGNEASDAAGIVYGFAEGEGSEPAGGSGAKTNGPNSTCGSGGLLDYPHTRGLRSFAGWQCPRN